MIRAATWRMPARPRGGEKRSTRAWPGCSARTADSGYWKSAAAAARSWSRCVGAATRIAAGSSSGRTRRRRRPGRLAAVPRRLRRTVRRDYCLGRLRALVERGTAPHVGGYAATTGAWRTADLSDLQSAVSLRPAHFLRRCEPSVPGHAAPDRTPAARGGLHGTHPRGGNAPLRTAERSSIRLAAPFAGEAGVRAAVLSLPRRVSRGAHA